MAKSSTHIAKGNSGYLSHNSREKFSHSQVFFDESNELWNDKKEAFTMYRDELRIRSEAYTKRTKQQLQKRAVTHLSAITNLNQHHTLEDIEPLKDWIENKLDTKVFQVAIHRDEGKLRNKHSGEILTSGEDFFCNPKDEKLYHDKKYTQEIDINDWEFEKNYHAHFEFMGLDSEGNSVRRKLSSSFFRRLQDETAKLLDMERGRKGAHYTKEQLKEIRAAIPPRNQFTSDKAYGQAFVEKAKELGMYVDTFSAKRLDTHEFKKAKSAENKASLAKQKDLKAEIAELRAELKAQKANREAYAKLEQLNRDLKARIRIKDLTSQELNSIVINYKALHQTQEQIKEMEHESIDEAYPSLENYASTDEVYLLMDDAYPLMDEVYPSLDTEEIQKRFDGMVTIDEDKALIDDLKKENREYNIKIVEKIKDNLNLENKLEDRMEKYTSLRQAHTKLLKAFNALKEKYDYIINKFRKEDDNDIYRRNI